MVLIKGFYTGTAIVYVRPVDEVYKVGDTDGCDDDDDDDDGDSDDDSDNDGGNDYYDDDDGGDSCDGD